ncbi:DJ-1/PfpI family protein [uncultured archaeon]|nr:DJ-1/PfpI family protein [uncultured archaeon]
MADVKVAIVIPPKNFKDETLSMLSLLLSKKDIRSLVAGFGAKDSLGSHGAVAKLDVAVTSLDPATVDALIIADGPGVDSFRLYEYRPLLEIVRAFHESKRLVVGVGNGIKVLAKANVIRDAKIAAADKETASLVALYHGLQTDSTLVLDKNVITLSDSSKMEQLAERVAAALGTA